MILFIQMNSHSNVKHVLKFNKLFKSCYKVLHSVHLTHLQSSLSHEKPSPQPLAGGRAVHSQSQVAGLQTFGGCLLHPPTGGGLQTQPHDFLSHIFRGPQPPGK